jgi:small subunit ribosomal protein S20
LARSKSILKRIRQNDEHRLRNRHIRSFCKTILKRVNQSVENRDTEKANQDLALAMSTLHKAASKGAIHHNTASRKIARLAKRLSNQQIPK